MALCNVLQFFVNTGDKRLSSIIVKGERIFQQDEGNKKSQSIKLNYIGTPPYGHLINMVTSLLRLFLSPRNTLYECVKKVCGSRHKNIFDSIEQVHSFYYRSINFWNKLRTDIKSVDSFHTFKRRLLDFYDDETVSYNLPSSEGVNEAILN